MIGTVSWAGASHPHVRVSPGPGRRAVFPGPSVAPPAWAAIRYWWFGNEGPRWEAKKSSAISNRWAQCQGEAAWTRGEVHPRIGRTRGRPRIRGAMAAGYTGYRATRRGGAMPSKGIGRSVVLSVSLAWSTGLLAPAPASADAGTTLW